jgi:tetrahydromethanopterin S-methyltransferase subunit A
MALIRKLLNYRWELHEHSVTLIGTTTKESIVLDKVRLMSFMKFAVNCMDKMRIEDIKKLRKQIADIKAKDRAKREAKAKIKIEIQKEKLFNDLDERLNKGIKV